jgi:hypothetical protein
VGAWAAVRQSYDGCPSAASRRRLLSRAPWESYRVSSAEHALGHAEHKAHHLPAAPALQAPAAEAVAAQPLTTWTRKHRRCRSERPGMGLHPWRRRRRWWSGKCQPNRPKYCDFHRGQRSQLRRWRWRRWKPSLWDTNTQPQHRGRWINCNHLYTSGLLNGARAACSCLRASNQIYQRQDYTFPAIRARARKLILLFGSSLSTQMPL